MPDGKAPIKTLAFVDVENLFYGIKRFTGDPTARVDFVKLKETFRTSREDLFLAYVVTPVMGSDSAQPFTMKDDAWFLHFLRKAGYRVRRHYARIFQDEGSDTVQFDRTSAAREMIFDAIRHVPNFDRVVLVSGAGGTISLADKVREHSKTLVVASFEHAGDLNSGLKARADERVQLDGTFRYLPTDRRFRAKGER